jgi:hypothetical protein
VISTQPQLLHIALDPGDVVYTPDWVVRDMVEYFKPSGRILEPCCGDGAFMRYLPADALWCEIERGRDFFAWSQHVDWIIGNPPYNLIDEWLDHSFQCANDILYLIPMNYPFNSWKRIRSIIDYGNIKAMRCYDKNRIFGNDYNRPMSAFHFKRGYTGATMITMFDGEKE